MVLAGRGENEAAEGPPPGIGAHAVEDFQSADLGHHQVEDHQSYIGRLFQRRERFGAIVDQRDDERPLLELRLDDPTDVRLVVGDEHMHRSDRWEGTHARFR